MNKQKLKIDNGITLVALIITIVVLLILAGVTIGILQESNIIGYAQKAGNSYTIAQEKEQIGLALSEWQLESVKTENNAIFKNVIKDALQGQNVNVDGENDGPLTVKFNKTENKYIVTKEGEIGGLIIEGDEGNNGDEGNGGEEVMPVEKGIKIAQEKIILMIEKEGNVTVELIGDLEGEVIYSSSNENIATINSDGKIFAKNEGTAIITVSCGDCSDTCEIEVVELRIGVAKNTDKYGAKVSGYNVATGEFASGVWRLYYQDDIFTYLITDELVGAYNLNDNYSSYANGADVSYYGRKLCPSLSNAFTASNTNANIRATAWLTDPEVWRDYNNEDTLFAIGSPTLELLAASYNSAAQGKVISFSAGNTGYSCRANDYFYSGICNGIYGKNEPWWLIAPEGSRNSENIGINGSLADLYKYDIYTYSLPGRPVVCMLTSVFESKYLSTLEVNSEV